MQMARGNSVIRRRKQLVPRLLEEQRWRCCYCICELVYSSSKRKKNNFATLEHVEPRYTFKTGTNFQKNGKDYGHFSAKADNYDNCVVACAKCNHLRGSLDAYLFFEQELWKPENAQRQKIHHLMGAFQQYKSIRTLRKLGNHHCECKGPWPNQIEDRLLYATGPIDLGYEKGEPVVMVNMSAITKIAIKYTCIIETKPVEAGPSYIGVRLTRFKGKT